MQIIQNILKRFCKYFYEMGKAFKMINICLAKCILLSNTVNKAMFDLIWRVPVLKEQRRLFKPTQQCHINFNWCGVVLKVTYMLIFTPSLLN